MVHPSDDRQSKMELALKRSVTLVIWYKSSCDPIRLTHEISTFPLFSLSHYPTVVADLELTSSSHVDAYNSATGHWEQHLITTVRSIESGQRLLYKVRKSLLAGLADDDCTGLAEELALQLKKKVAQLKRPLADTHEVPSAKRFYFPDSYPHVYIPPPMGYMLPTQTIPYAPPLTTRSANETADTPFHSQSTTTPAAAAAATTTRIPSPPVPTTPLYSPVHTPSTTTSRMPHHLPVKRWPNDYTVSEIAAGFRAMDALVAQSPSATQKAAFERVFGCRYVKSTVCRHRGVYRKADAGLRTLFEAMGNDERAVWGEFVRRVEGRQAVADKGCGSGDEKGMQDPAVGTASGGGGAESAGIVPDRNGQTGPEAMIAQMGHMTMQAGE